MSIIISLKMLKRKLRFFRAEFVYLFIANRDKNVRELLKLQIATKYLIKRYVDPYFKKHEVETIKTENIGIFNTVWIYWAQGLENAPDMVKCCINSIISVFKNAGWDIKLLNNVSVKEYVDLPNYIWKKYDRGLISNAHLSDLIRLNLLVKRGGCWCDATVLCTGNLPGYICEHELFLFRGDLRNNEYINISNWFIYSMKEHPILVSVYDILLEYWKKEDVVIQYFIFHIVFKLVTDKYSEYWKNLPIYSNVLPHLLQQKLIEPYSNTMMEEICNITSIHKLYWRTPKNIEENSFYNVILSGVKSYEKS